MSTPVSQHPSPAATTPPAARPRRGKAALALAAAATMLLGSAGTAGAQSLDARNNTTPIGPVYDVAEVARGEIRDPFFTGQIPLIYRAGGGCATADFATPGQSRSGAQVLVTQDLPEESTNFAVNPMDWRKFVRTNDRMKVTWTNTTNGRSGTAEGFGTGFEVGAQFDSGPGTVEVEVEMVSSILPPFPGDSVENPFVDRSYVGFTLQVPGC